MAPVAPSMGPLLAASPPPAPVVPARVEAVRRPPTDRASCTDRRPVECEEGPIRYSRFLDRVNEEYRAAIESERLLAHLMAWPDVRAPEPPPAPRRMIPGWGREVRNHAAPPPARGDTPRLGQVSPVGRTAIDQRVPPSPSLPPAVVSGRMIDLFA